MINNNSLRGKHILFIGGCGEIGRVTAEILLSEGANLTITTPAITTDTKKVEKAFNELIVKSKLTARFQIIKADITVEEDVKKQIKEAKKLFGNIDHLVITAGVSHLGKLLDVTRKEWDLIIDVNVWGILRSIQEALPHLNKGARIVIIGSDVGLGKPSHDIPLYSISKATLHQIIMLLAQELPEHDASISGIAPYNTPPGMHRVYSKKGGKLICEKEDCNTPDWGNLPPTGKFIDSKSLAKTVSFLLQSSADFNGTIIPVTGGYGMTVS